jgi:transposase
MTADGADTARLADAITTERQRAQGLLAEVGDPDLKQDLQSALRQLDAATAMLSDPDLAEAFRLTTVERQLHKATAAIRSAQQAWQGQ